MADAQVSAAENAKSFAILTYCQNNLWWCLSASVQYYNSNQSETPGYLECTSNNTFSLDVPVKFLTQIPLVPQGTPSASTSRELSLPSTVSASDQHSSSAIHTIKSSRTSSSAQISLVTGNGTGDTDRASTRLAIGLGVPLGVFAVTLIVLFAYKLYQRQKLRSSNASDVPLDQQVSPKAVEKSGDRRWKISLKQDEPAEKCGVDLAEAP